MVLVDTVLTAIFRYKDGAVPPTFLRHCPSIKLLFAELRDVYAQLSYVADWRDASCNVRAWTSRFAISTI